MRIPKKKKFISLMSFMLGFITALSLKVINVTSKLRILFRVMFTKHSPEFYLICANLASNAPYYCRLSQGILGLFQLIPQQAFGRLA